MPAQIKGIKHGIYGERMGLVPNYSEEFLSFFILNFWEVIYKV